MYEKKQNLQALALLGFWLPHVVRHVKGYGQREFDEPTELLAVVPGHLVNKLFHAVFFDSVGVKPLVVKQVFQYGSRMWRMAVEQVVAYYFVAVAVHVGRSLVHVEDVALFVADGDGNLLETFEIFFHFLNVKSLISNH